MEIGTRIFEKSGRQTHRQTQQLYIYRHQLVQSVRIFLNQGNCNRFTIACRDGQSKLPCS